MGTPSKAIGVGFDFPNVTRGRLLIAAKVPEQQTTQRAWVFLTVTLLHPPHAIF